MSRVKKVAIAAALLVVALGVGAFGALRYYQAASLDPAFFESDILAFEEADRAHPPAAGTVVFTGSSSIRRWDDLARDMAPLRVLNRGFGGSQVSHLVHNAERLLPEARPAAVVVYSGGNDTDASTGKGADTVVADYQRFAQLLDAKHPGVPLYILSIKPTQLRWSRWPLGAEANEHLRRWADAEPDVHFVDVATPMLGDDGRPRDELFVFDGLHLNDAGYALWTSILRPRLLRDLGVEPPEPH